MRVVDMNRGNYENTAKKSEHVNFSIVNCINFIKNMTSQTKPSEWNRKDHVKPSMILTIFNPKT